MIVLTSHSNVSIPLFSLETDDFLNWYSAIANFFHPPIPVHIFVIILVQKLLLMNFTRGKQKWLPSSWFCICVMLPTMKVDLFLSFYPYSWQIRGNGSSSGRNGFTWWSKEPQVVTHRHVYMCRISNVFTFY